MQCFECILFLFLRYLSCALSTVVCSCIVWVGKTGSLDELLLLCKRSLVSSNRVRGAGPQSRGLMPPFSGPLFPPSSRHLVLAACCLQRVLRIKVKTFCLTHFPVALATPHAECTSPFPAPSAAKTGRWLRGKGKVAGGEWAWPLVSHREPRFAQVPAVLGSTASPEGASAAEPGEEWDPLVLP